jgi:hypothetical protein
MPIHEFKCAAGHITEKFFKTFEEVDQLMKVPGIGEPYLGCECGLHARMIDSVPGHPICYGQGFYKPAASGATSYTRSDPSKAAAEVIDEIGPKNLVQGVKKAGK